MAGELWKTALGGLVGGAARGYTQQLMWGQRGRGQSGQVTAGQLFDIAKMPNKLEAYELMRQAYPLARDEKQREFISTFLKNVRENPAMQKYLAVSGATLPPLEKGAEEPGLWEQFTQGASTVGETMGEMFGLTDDPQFDAHVRQRQQDRATNEQQMVAMNAQGQFLQQKHGMLRNLAILEQVVSGAPDDGVKKVRMADFLQRHNIPPKVLKGYKPDQYQTIVQGLRRTINAAQTPEAIQGALTQFRTGDPLSQGKAVDDLFHRGGAEVSQPDERPGLPLVEPTITETDLPSMPEVAETPMPEETARTSRWTPDDAERLAKLYGEVETIRAGRGVGAFNEKVLQDTQEQITFLQSKRTLARAHELFPNDPSKAVAWTINPTRGYQSLSMTDLGRKVFGTLAEGLNKGALGVTMPVKKVLARLALINAEHGLGIVRPEVVQGVEALANEHGTIDATVAGDIIAVHTEAAKERQKEQTVDARLTRRLDHQSDMVEMREKLRRQRQAAALKTTEAIRARRDQVLHGHDLTLLNQKQNFAQQQSQRDSQERLRELGAQYGFIRSVELDKYWHSRGRLNLRSVLKKTETMEMQKGKDRQAARMALIGALIDQKKIAIADLRDVLTTTTDDPTLKVLLGAIEGALLEPGATPYRELATKLLRGKMTGATAEKKKANLIFGLKQILAQGEQDPNFPKADKAWLSGHVARLEGRPVPGDDERYNFQEVRAKIVGMSGWDKKDTDEKVMAVNAYLTEIGAPENAPVQHDLMEWLLGRGRAIATAANAVSEQVAGLGGHEVQGALRTIVNEETRKANETKNAEGSRFSHERDITAAEVMQAAGIKPVERALTGFAKSTQSQYQAAVTTGRLLNEMITLVGDHPEIVTALGAFQTWWGGMAQQAVTIWDALFGEERTVAYRRSAEDFERSGLEYIKKKYAWFSTEERDKYQVMQGLVVYNIARMLDPTGRLSDKDVQKAEELVARYGIFTAGPGQIQNRLKKLLVVVRDTQADLRGLAEREPGGKAALGFNVFDDLNDALPE